MLPAMDYISALYVLARILGPLNANQSNEDNFEIMIYDGVSSDETLRMIGAASKARLAEFLTSSSSSSLSTPQLSLSQTVCIQQHNWTQIVFEISEELG